MNKEQLLARAQELGIQVLDGATNKVIEDLIKIAEHPLLLASAKQMDAEIGSLNAAIENAVTKHSEEIEALKTSYSEEIEKQNSIIANLEKLITDDSDKAKSSEFARYKKGKETYVFTVKAFRFKGEKYDVTEAVKDKDLMDQIIDAKFIHLKKI